MHRCSLFPALFIVLVLFSAAPSPGAEEEEQGGNLSGFALPVMFYTPDTGFGYGAAGLMGYRTREARISQVVLSVIHTTKNQFEAVTQWTHNFPGDRTRLLLDVEYSRFPQYYYRGGNAASNIDPSLYTPEKERVELSIDRAIYGGLRVKVGGFFRNCSIQDRDGAVAFLSSGAPWAAGRMDIGPKLGFVRDTRDNTTAPLSGMFAQAYYQGSWLRDGGRTFSIFTGEIRTYREVFPQTILASMLLVMDTRGDAPFYFLPYLGGQNRLRGYEFNRFTGRSLVLAQEDIRFPIRRWLGGCAFVGAGRVADTVADLSGPRWHFSGGAGLRFFINRADGLVLRFDKAFGNGVQGTYITFGEAF